MIKTKTQLLKFHKHSEFNLLYNDIFLYYKLSLNNNFITKKDYLNFIFDSAFSFVKDQEENYDLWN